MRRLTIPMPFPVPAQERYVPYDMMLNDVGFWYPILKRAQVRTPFTVMVGDWGRPDITALKIQEAMDLIGYPCFFRGGSIAASLKHKWDKTCFIYKRLAISEIISRMKAIVSHCVSGNAGAESLLTENWIIREYIECENVSRYRDMPLKKEIRVFIDNNKVSCMHHYWEGQIPLEEISFSSKEIDYVRTEAQKVAEYFYGYWSCDFLLASNGCWYAIDMALGEDSFHGARCQKIREGIVNVG